MRRFIYSSRPGSQVISLGICPFSVPRWLISWLPSCPCHIVDCYARFQSPLTKVSTIKSNQSTLGNHPAWLQFKPHPSACDRDSGAAPVVGNPDRLHAKVQNARPDIQPIVKPPRFSWFMWPSERRRLPAPPPPLPLRDAEIHTPWSFAGRTLSERGIEAPL